MDTYTWKIKIFFFKCLNVDSRAKSNIPTSENADLKTRKNILRRKDNSIIPYFKRRNNRWLKLPVGEHSVVIFGSMHHNAICSTLFVCFLMKPPTPPACSVAF